MFHDIKHNYNKKKSMPVFQVSILGHITAPHHWLFSYNIITHHGLYLISTIIAENINLSSKEKYLTKAFQHFLF